MPALLAIKPTTVSEPQEQQRCNVLIQERTGHQSVKALRVYERSTAEQHKAVSTLLSSVKGSTFQQNLVEVRLTIKTFITCRQEVLNQNLTGYTINIVKEKTEATQ